MRYANLRPSIRDGDVALVSGSNIFSLIIRFFSVSTWSHVAVFFYDGDALLVSEMHELKGHRITHASTWIDEQLTSGKLVKIAFAPERVRGKKFVSEFIEQHRCKSTRYAFWALPFVWLSNITGINLPGTAWVCSWYVQKCWKHSGRALLPRDFGLISDALFTIRSL